MAAWSLTRHAKERLADRGIAVDQLDALLATPEITFPQDDPDLRLYQRAGVTAVVNVVTHEVVTVGIHGASRRDWESFPAPPAGALPPEPVRLKRWRKRPVEPGGPVTKRSVLDGVEPDVAAGVRELLTKLGLDFRSVRVVSPTRVEIVPPPTSR